MTTDDCWRTDEGGAVRVMTRASKHHERHQRDADCLDVHACGSELSGLLLRIVMQDTMGEVLNMCKRS